MALWTRNDQCSNKITARFLPPLGLYLPPLRLYHALPHSRPLHHIRHLCCRSRGRGPASSPHGLRRHIPLHPGCSRPSEPEFILLNATDTFTASNLCIASILPAAAQYRTPTPTFSLSCCLHPGWRVLLHVSFLRIFLQRVLDLPSCWSNCTTLNTACPHAPSRPLTPPHARDPLAFQLTGITGQHGGDKRQLVCSLQPTVLLQHHANCSHQHQLCQSHWVVRAIWKVHNLWFFVGVLGSALTTLMQCVPAAAVEGGGGCRRSCCCRRQPV